MNTPRSLDRDKITSLALRVFKQLRNSYRSFTFSKCSFSTCCQKRSSRTQVFWITMASFVTRAAPRVRICPSCQFARPTTSLLLRSFATATEEQPHLRLGSVAPNFKAQTTHSEIDFHSWIGNQWTILFSHPADFTPVCTTELGAFAKMKGDFDKRGVKLIGLSANDLSSHGRWIQDINETSKTNLQFPIIADADRKIAYSMIWSTLKT